MRGETATASCTSTKHVDHAQVTRKEYSHGFVVSFRLAGSEQRREYPFQGCLLDP